MPYKHHHAGHRARLRNRFKKSPDSLEDHELVELLLFYAIPQKDTNTLAHDLLHRFGSLSKLMSADAFRISQVPGMGETSSLLFPVVFELFRRDLRSRLSEKSPKAYDPKHVGGQYLSKFFGRTAEHVIAMALDQEGEVFAEIEIGNGDFDSAPVNEGLAYQFAYQNSPCDIVLAHNHPSGIALPSQADYEVTDSLRKVISSGGCRLLDHLIFDGRGDFVSLGASGQMDGKNRFYYKVRQVKDSSGMPQFVIKQESMVADIMTKKKTLQHTP